MITRTADLHKALIDVADSAVDFFPGYSGHAQGFAWHQGGEVPQSEQDALAELTVVCLVNTAGPALGRDRLPVVITPVGEAVLAVWDQEVGA